MKTKLLFLLLCFVSIGLNAQTGKNYIATLLSLNGRGLLTRPDSIIELKIPQNYLTGDKFLMKKGKAVIMLFSGEEIALKENQHFLLEEDKNKVKNSANYEILSTIGKMVGLAQSNSAYNMRTIAKKGNLFPKSAKILTIDSSIIMLNFKTNEGSLYSFEIIDTEANRTIWSKEYLQKNEIRLNELNLQQGRTYSWTITCNSQDIEETGKYYYISQNEKQNLPSFPLVSKTDYLISFEFYYKNDYLFEAQKTLEKAIDKFEDNELFKYLLNELIKGNLKWANKM